MTDPTSLPRCVALKKNGEPCGAMFGLSDQGYCIAHDVERKAQAHAGRIAGARARGRGKVIRSASRELTPPEPKCLEDAIHWASWATRACAVGEIDGKTAHEIGYLLSQFLSAVSKRDLEKALEHERQRVRELLAQKPELRRA
jgi:hypothetical protein